MSLAVMEISPSALEVIVQGKLEKHDYQDFIPGVEKRIKTHGKISLLLNVSNFHGWSLGALWEDLKFDARHYNDVERLAMVSRNSDKKWMVTISRPFTAAEVRFFPEDAHETARKWVLNSGREDQ